MLDAHVLAQFKVSNNTALTGWNSTMSIIDILAQLQNSYGKLNMMTLFNNDTLFRSPMKPGDSPEMLFYRLEQCQEVQRIGKVPYSDEQIIANAIRILATSNIFPLKEYPQLRRAPRELPESSQRAPRELPESSQRAPIAPFNDNDDDFWCLDYTVKMLIGSR
jgi:hypothetical protein